MVAVFLEIVGGIAVVGLLGLGLSRTREYIDWKKVREDDPRRPKNIDDREH